MLDYRRMAQAAEKEVASKIHDQGPSVLDENGRSVSARQLIIRWMK
jgi:hypothetical protein